ncbi:MAG: transcription elongation factor GreA [Candidatus Moranbacteria bacterium]|nr:transcription elongation factor GreA [Candidatus Moranbacteria bacterium]
MGRPITKAGYQKLLDELNERTVTIRQEIAQAIKEAKEQGDLSENAEYATAKQRQSENEIRITELEMLIKEAEIVEHDEKSDSVQIGSKVTVKNGEREILFEIVSPNEVDPANFKVSNESPVGTSLMGKKKGGVAKVQTPNGVIEYTIIDIK